MQMKKLNNKGFTLIELLAVLVILVIIMSIAIPSITSSVERSKAKQREQVINIVKSQAELYLDKHNNLSSGSVITIGNLICGGYLTLEEAKDPMNDKYTVNVGFKVGEYSTLTKEESDAYRITISDGVSCS